MKDKKIKNLKVCENLAVDGNTYIKGTLSLVGSSNLPTISTNTLSAYNVIVNSNQTIAGSLTVSGNTILKGLSSSELANLHSLNVYSNTNIGDNLTVFGKSILSKSVTIPDTGSLKIGNGGSNISYFYTNFFAIPAGNFKITVVNPNITINSLVLVSLSSELDDDIYVTNKINGSFDVKTGTGISVTSDTLFTYIIINVS